MKAEYDFSQSRKNPYIQHLPKREVTIQLEDETISYFQGLAHERGVPYQELITLYLRDCAKFHQELVHAAL
ncbi:MAG: antitoxin [Candidatus Vecturithrix sp.]|jgi:predicted DNA binding CopG/RHH family protein|nr:antitoxin [Candidatus Vecturithrix sp.]